jgi:protein TonB
MQGCPDATGPGLQVGLEAGAKDLSPSVAAPANQELPNSHSAAENVPKPRPAPHPAKTQRVAALPKEKQEIRCEQQIPTAQTEAGAGRSESPGQTAQAGAGAAGGASNGVCAGGGNEPGGSGVAERSFGSPDGPNFLNKVLPAYPALARRLEKEGTVLLRLTIDDRGRPVEVEVLKKAGFGFDEEAVRAVRSSTFVPAKKEGKPLACKALLPIRFVLKNS